MSDKSSIIKETQKYLARGQIDKAIAEWEKLIKEYPDGNNYNTLGDLYLKKGDKQNAIDSFHKAANFFRHEGFSLKALALYKKILNINPSDPDSLYSLGELNEEKGLTTDAIKYYLATADSLSKEGKKEKLLDIYDKVLTLSPANIPLRNKVAEIYAKEGLMSEATKQYFQIAMLHAEKGEIEKSIGYYQKVLGAQPLNREAILGINYLYEKTGNLEKAIEQMKEATTLFPQDTDIHLRCAEIHIMSGMFDEAREYLGKVTEIEPANIKARRLLGDIYINEGDREKAWTEYLPVLDEMILDEKYDDAIKLLDSFKDIDPLETGKRLVSLYRQLGEQDHIANELISLGDVLILKDMQKEALNCYKEALEITPDNESLSAKVAELDKEVSKELEEEFISIKTEKSVDEAIVEADIFLRYGLYDNVKNLLEVYKDREPENIELHLRLKSLYVDTGDKEQAITECLILNELYKKAGDISKGEQVIKEAYEISPEDQRLISVTAPPLHEKEEEVTITPSEGPAIEDYSEEIAEADFYSKQGLTDEARAILERLQTLFPENKEIGQKLDSLGQVVETEQKTEHIEEKQEEIILTESEILEAEEIHEPTLDSDVMDIFNEFKKGLEKELDEEDYETHYNLGIAYKEMGLTDDAIREFQTSRNNPKRFVPSSSMLGICYMEKGLYPLAIDVLRNAIEKMEDRGESYWSMKYDLAEAYEKKGNLKEALDLYTAVYGWNSKFRSVSDKLTNLRAKVTEDGVEQKKTKDRKDRVSYL
jgi:tetratricopeptide (TPR) repeat protein